MSKHGYCITCDKTFPLEVRVAGKLVAAGTTALIGAKAKLPPLAKIGLGLGSFALAHIIDEQMSLRCPTEGCTTILKVVDAALT